MKLSAERQYQNPKDVNIYLVEPTDHFTYQFSKLRNALRKKQIPFTALAGFDKVKQMMKDKINKNIIVINSENEKQSIPPEVIPMYSNEIFVFPKERKNFKPIAGSEQLIRQYRDLKGQKQKPKIALKYVERNIQNGSRKPDKPKFDRVIIMKKRQKSDPQYIKLYDALQKNKPAIISIEKENEINKYKSQTCILIMEKLSYQQISTTLSQKNSKSSKMYLAIFGYDRKHLENKNTVITTDKPGAIIRYLIDSKVKINQLTVNYDKQKDVDISKRKIDISNLDISFNSQQAGTIKQIPKQKRTQTNIIYEHAPNIVINTMSSISEGDQQDVKKLGFDQKNTVVPANPGNSAFILQNGANSQIMKWEIEPHPTKKNEKTSNPVFIQKKVEQPNKIQIRNIQTIGYNGLPQIKEESQQDNRFSHSDTTPPNLSNLKNSGLIRINSLNSNGTNTNAIATQSMTEKREQQHFQNGSSNRLIINDSKSAILKPKILKNQPNRAQSVNISQNSLKLVSQSKIPDIDTNKIIESTVNNFVQLTNTKVIDSTINRIPDPNTNSTRLISNSNSNYSQHQQKIGPAISYSSQTTNISPKIISSNYNQGTSNGLNQGQTYFRREANTIAHSPTNEGKKYESFQRRQASPSQYQSLGVDSDRFEIVEGENGTKIYKVKQSYWKKYQQANIQGIKQSTGHGYQNAEQNIQTYQSSSPQSHIKQIINNGVQGIQQSRQNSQIGNQNNNNLNNQVTEIIKINQSANKWTTSYGNISPISPRQGTTKFFNSELYQEYTDQRGNKIYRRKRNADQNSNQRMNSVSNTINSNNTIGKLINNLGSENNLSPKQAFSNGGETIRTDRRTNTDFQPTSPIVRNFTSNQNQIQTNYRINGSTTPKVSYSRNSETNNETVNLAPKSGEIRVKQTEEKQKKQSLIEVKGVARDINSLTQETLGRELTSNSIKQMNIRNLKNSSSSRQYQNSQNHFLRNYTNQASETSGFSRDSQFTDRSSSVRRMIQSHHYGLNENRFTLDTKIEKPSDFTKLQQELKSLKIKGNYVHYIVQNTHPYRMEIDQIVNLQDKIIEIDYPDKFFQYMLQKPLPNEYYDIGFIFVNCPSIDDIDPSTIVEGYYVVDVYKQNPLIQIKKDKKRINVSSVKSLKLVKKLLLAPKIQYYVLYPYLTDPKISNIVNLFPSIKFQKLIYTDRKELETLLNTHLKNKGRLNRSYIFTNTLNLKEIYSILDLPINFHSINLVCIGPANQSMKRDFPRAKFSDSNFTSYGSVINAAGFGDISQFDRMSMDQKFTETENEQLEGTRNGQNQLIPTIFIQHPHKDLDKQIEKRIPNYFRFIYFKNPIQISLREKQNWVILHEENDNFGFNFDRDMGNVILFGKKNGRAPRGSVSLQTLEQLIQAIQP